MQKNFFRSFILICLQSFFAGTVVMAEWKVSDQYDYFDLRDGSAQSVVVTPNGEIFVGGAGRFNLQGGATSTWVVRKSSDQGQSWTTVDHYQLKPGEKSEVNSMAIGKNGLILAVGNTDDGVKKYGLIRRSLNGGRTWETVDLREGSMDRTKKIAISEDKIIVYEKFDIVLQSEDQGKTWTEINAGLTVPKDILATSHDLFLAVDMSIDGSDQIGLMTISADEETWNSIYKFVNPFSSYQLSSMVEDASQNIYVAISGRLKNTPGWVGWVLLKGRLDGSWAIIDQDMIGVDYYSAWMLKLIADKDNIYFSHVDSAGNYLVKYSLDGAQTWQTNQLHLNPKNYFYDIQKWQTSIYMVGQANPNAGGFDHQEWTVAKFDLLSHQLETVDSYREITSMTETRDIEVSPNGALVTIGNFIDQNLNHGTAIRISEDQGLSWNTVDVFQLGDTYYRDLTIDPSGNYFTIGTNRDRKANRDDAFVRFSLNKGQTWMNAQINFCEKAQNPSDGISINADKKGNLFAAAYCEDHGNYSKVVMISSDSAKTWQKIGILNFKGLASQVKLSSKGEIFMVIDDSDTHTGSLIKGAYDGKAWNWSSVSKVNNFNPEGLFHHFEIGPNDQMYVTAGTQLFQILESGKSWKKLISPPLPPNIEADPWYDEFAMIRVSSSGTVYAALRSADFDSHVHGLLYSMNPASMDWILERDSVSPGYYNLIGYSGFAEDQNGNQYVSGNEYAGPNANHWIVLRK